MKLELVWCTLSFLLKKKKRLFKNTRRYSDYLESETEVHSLLLSRTVGACLAKWSKLRLCGKQKEIFLLVTTWQIAFFNVFFLFFFCEYLNSWTLNLATRWILWGEWLRELQFFSLKKRRLTRETLLLFTATWKEIVEVEVGLPGNLVTISRKLAPVCCTAKSKTLELCRRNYLITYLK